MKEKEKSKKGNEIGTKDKKNKLKKLMKKRDPAALVELRNHDTVW